MQALTAGKLGTVPTTSEQSAMDAYGPVGRSEWQDIDWQQHMRWVRVEDRWMNLVDIGEGPVILMIHGLAGSWQNWLENIPFFARDHRVIAVDLPGFGESEMPAKDISISRYADTVDALLDELDIDQPVRLLGNSMGGFIGAELAIRYPQRIERLVLVAAAGLSVDNIRTKLEKGLRHRAENVAFFNIGWIALELAAAGEGRSVTAIAPAGLWAAPLAPKRGIARALARGLGPVMPALTRSARGREAGFSLSSRRSTAQPNRSRSTRSM